MSRLIIFEGTDGTGKSFASVQTYRELDRAALLHYREVELHQRILRSG
jgi:thymidylate kinase